jgi:hypothetical protein
MKNPFPYTTMAMTLDKHSYLNLRGKDTVNLTAQIYQFKNLTFIILIIIIDYSYQNSTIMHL